MRPSVTPASTNPASLLPCAASNATANPYASSQSELGELAVAWDAVIVGAGPAGGMAALRLAERGHRVLLVEAKNFPREKVCGGCLNRRAWGVLAAAGLTAALEQAGAIELKRLHLACGRRSADWAMPTMHAVSRSRLDQEIVAAAVDRGATFLCGTQGRIEVASPGADRIGVQLKQPGTGKSTRVQARVAIAADGLTHSSLAEHEEAASRVASGSRIGLGTSFIYEGQSFAAGRLTMAVGRAGYVGITRVEQGRLNLASAISTGHLRDGAGPAAVISQLLREAGLEVPDGVQDAQWYGTPQLTRESRRWSARRVFLVGDAAGYVEPFTGEGMSWALAGGHAVCQYAELAISAWSDSLASQWHQRWRRHVRSHQAICRTLAWLLRRPRLAEAALGGTRYAPWLTGWIMEGVAGSVDTRLPRWAGPAPGRLGTGSARHWNGRH